jgi:serine/threonine-protein kinase RsbW
MTTNQRGGAAAAPGARARRMAALGFPADKGYLALARTTAMHIAGLLDLPLSRVTDLRLAVDEACTAFLTAGRASAADVLELRYDLLPGRLCVSVRGPVPDSWPEVDELGWTMLQALVSEVRTEVDRGIGTLTLVEELPPQPEASDPRDAER